MNKSWDGVQVGTAHVSRFSGCTAESLWELLRFLASTGVPVLGDFNCHMDEGGLEIAHHFLVTMRIMGLAVPGDGWLNSPSSTLDLVFGIAVGNLEMIPLP